MKDYVIMQDYGAYEGWRIVGEYDRLDDMLDDYLTKLKEAYGSPIAMFSHYIPRVALG
jgi:hypothetical protein